LILAVSDNRFDGEAIRELRVLQAVEVDPSISQRALARDMGVAVGVVNACVRTLVRKGQIKIRGENNRTITYHLTSEGALRKTALAMQWTANTLEFYRSARRGVAERLQELTAAGHRRAVLYGANELAEITVLVSPGSSLEVVVALAGVDLPVGDAIIGVPVILGAQAVPVAEDVDLVLLCEIASDDVLDSLRRGFPDAQLFSLLGQPIAEDSI
jgi:DNA-binding MarR family transcriptional regulator